MATKPNCDRAKQYLSSLQTNYRIDEFRVDLSPAVTEIQVVKSAGDRILLHMAIELNSTITLYIKKPSGVLMPVTMLGAGTGLTSILYTMALHYSMPNMEFWATGTTADFLTGYAISKM